MASPVLKFKRGTQSAFAAVGLQTGEPAFINDEFNFYIGLDGTSANNKFFGSSRYWRKEDTTNGGGVNLFGSRAVGVAGTAITLAAPASVGAAVTYFFPATQGATQSVLTNDGNGNLSWSSGSLNAVFSGITTVNGTAFDVNVNSDFSGITTFSNTTDSTTKDTGAVVVEGGVGIEKSLNVGGNLKVTGVSTFVGNVTFEGGTVTLGDANTDNVVFAADVNSNILPNTDATFDIGDSTVSKRWRHASFSGVGTFATGVVADGVQIGINGVNEIDTSSGNLTLDSAGGQTIIDDNLNVTGVSTFVGVTTFTTNNVFISQQLFVGGVNITGGATLGQDLVTRNLRATGISTFQGVVNVDNSVRVGAGLSVVGVSTFTGEIDGNGGLNISGGEAILSSATVSDLTAGRVVLAGTSGALVDDSSLTFSDAAGLTVANSGINVTGVSTFSTDVRVSGDITVAGNDIRDSGGTAAITFDGSGNTTITGNLNVNGSTTQVNTTALTIEDRTIELGKVDGAATTTTTWDLGVLFNWGDAGTARKSAVIWEHADSRFKFAKILDADTDGTNSSTPQLTISNGNFAPIEIAELWVNNSCVSNTATRIIGCTGSTLLLENITIDCGTF